MATQEVTRGTFAMDLTEQMHICSKCQHSCEQTLAYCLKRGEEYSESARIEALIDCAELCGLCVSFMGRESGLHPLVCHTCAAACFTCAQSCAELSGNDERMQHCAEVCRQCAEICDNIGDQEFAN